MRTILAIAVLAGCSGSDAATEHKQPTVTYGQHDPRPAESVVDLQGDASGAWWDGQALVLTDSTHGTLERWTPAGGFQQLVAFPDHKIELGGVVVLRDGRTLVTSFGFGKDGGVYIVAPDHAVTKVPNLAPERRRIGLTVASDGAIYVSYFVVQAGNKRVGGVARLDPASGETDVAGDLEKPVGLVASDKTLFVADQEQRTIVGYPLADLAHPAIIARDLPSADLLTLLPNGDLVTGGKRGAVYRITPAGAVATIAGGYEQVRGTAYDPVNHKLFVVDHSAVSSRHKLHILEVQ